MARKGAKAPAIDLMREASLDASVEEVVDEASLLGDGDHDETSDAETRVRKPKVVDPAIAALFAAGAEGVHEQVLAASKLWRDATEREAPSIERLAAPGVITHIDVDAASGYVSVATNDDVWRAFLAREQLATVLALLLRRPVVDVAAAIARGPVKLTQPVS
jgi:hypothetical protein